MNPNGWYEVCIVYSCRSAGPMVAFDLTVSRRVACESVELLSAAF
jgi:hypothetical protein